MDDLILTSKSFPALQGVHAGTGAISGSAHVAVPDSVGKDINTPMEFSFSPYNIQVLSMESNLPDAPNWFGVSYRKGITSFDTVNIFCHPHPGNAGMAEGDYGARGGNWPRLFRYAGMFGWQMAIAKTNHITIVPFFTDSTYASTGIFATHWLDIVEQIIVAVRNSAQSSATATAGANGRTPNIAVTEVNRLVTQSATRKKGAPPPVRTSSDLLRNVVLSCFSRGRVLMASVRGRAQGINHFLQEVWDFDGVGGAPPGGIRAITYDQHKTALSSHDHFHVPPERWVKYHNMVVANAHGDIPAMLATHAATISKVGK